MLFMKSMDWRSSQLQMWAQRIVITILFISSGCIEQLNPKPLGEQNRSVLQQIPGWSLLATEARPGSTGHLGDILALRQVSDAPTQVISVGTDGNIISWALESGSGSLLKQIGGTMQLATFGEQKALVAWTSGNSVRVACLAPRCEGSWELT
jgi:hypothetical protein